MNHEKYKPYKMSDVVFIGHFLFSHNESVFKQSEYMKSTKV